MSAKPGDHETIYRGQPVTDLEYGSVADLEYFDDIDDPITLTRETWQLITTEQIIVYPKIMLCTECEGEGEDEFEHQCHRCLGEGSDPLEGETVTQ